MIGYIIAPSFCSNLNSIAMFLTCCCCIFLLCVSSWNYLIVVFIRYINMRLFIIILMLFSLFCICHYVLVYFERRLCLCNQKYSKTKTSCKECPFLNRDIFLLMYMNSKCFTINSISAYIHIISNIIQSVSFQNYAPKWLHLNQCIWYY